MNVRQAAEIFTTTAKNVILGANLISLSLLKNPKKMADYVSENLFTYKAINSKRGIPQKNVFEVIPSTSIQSIKLANLSADENWFRSKASYTADIISLCLICQAVNPKTIFEIGTLRGYTTFHFALNTPPEARIFTLDLPKDGSVGGSLPTTAIDDIHIKSHHNSMKYYFGGHEVADKVTCLFGDSASYDFSAYYGKVDLFFIDGAHSYDYVRSDTLNALKCCHSGSIIAWHDFGRAGVNGVSKWISELSKDHEIYSIPGGSLAFLVLK